MPLVVYILGLAIFSIGTSELMIAGMMPSLATTFEVSIGQVGYLISYFAFGVMLGGPILTYFFLKFKAPYRPTLLILLILYALIQGISAFMNSFEILILIRIIIGVLCAGCLSLSLATSMSLVSIDKRPSAAAIVIGGFMISNVFGVPFATVIDEYWGWRASFGIVAIMVLLCFIALFFMLPSFKSHQAPSMADEIQAFKRSAYWKACLTSCLILGASFAAFSYFVPILMNITQMDLKIIPLILMLYGAANVIGNIITAKFAYRYSLQVMLIGLTVLTLSLLSMALLAQYQWLAISLVVMIGLSGVPMNPAMMARVVSVAHPGPMVNAVHTAVINIGLGGGSYLGGAAITAGLGYLSALWIGAFLAFLGLLSILPYAFRKKSGWE
ncbi:MFS transporter [Ignatzschineria rhizosphaerae]|uniref:MFS transporter n=1 Tax=Ignatzschineria rhizosphaerae TaxID=2923279 RepID=A0ABY3X4N2_9GAMM|nr:MFS transporter [Ignatzschineria rhizosphaerae]UNM95745.1 MFS transporter [Ignatzschineria rhizosphaerae]